MFTRLNPLLLACAVAALTLNTARAAPAGVPETGQTQCYDTAGHVISCTGTGQDGESKAGLAWPSLRFVAGTGTEVGCVIDRLTGLMWMQAPDTVLRTWSDALSYAEGLSFCGHDDWRLPNVNELDSLVHLGKPDATHASVAAWLNDPAQGFQGVQAGDYWSSSLYAAYPSIAWGVRMSDGYVNGSGKGATYYVWPVRGGQ